MLDADFWNPPIQEQSEQMKKRSFAGTAVFVILFSAWGAIAALALLAR